MSDQAPPKSAQEITLDALREIYERTREPVSREALILATDLPASTVDWHLRSMTASREDAVRCSAGGYRPIHRHPADRAVSLTPLDYGTLKVEIGDTVFTLTPGELSKLAPGLAGYAGVSLSYKFRVEVDDVRQSAQAGARACDVSYRVDSDLSDVQAAE